MGGPDGGLAASLCVLLGALVIGLSIAAVILRAAVALYNKMAGGPGSLTSVPKLSFGKAMGIVLVTTLLNAAVGFVIGLAIGGGAVATGQHGRGPEVLAQLISMPVGLLMMAAMLTALLPTTFGRALLVTLIYTVITILIVAGVVVLFVLVFGIATGMR